MADIPVNLADDLVGKLKALEALQGAAFQFGKVLTAGLRSAVVEGENLERVLQQVVLRLSDMALDAALGPLAKLLDKLAGSLISKIGGIILPGSEAAGSGGRLSEIGGQLGSGAGPVRVTGGATGPEPAAGASTQITFHVSTPDAESFRRSEAQVAAMLTRAVGRGRRGM